MSLLDTSSAADEVLDLDGAFAQAHASEQAFVRQALLDATREAIRMVDAQGNIVAENEAATSLDHELFGFGPDDEIGFDERQRLISQSVADPEAYLAALAELQHDLEFEQVIEWKHTATSRVFIRYARPVRNQSGQAIGRAFVTREITMEKENERLKDEFIALVSHELRTPLTSMIGFIDLLQDAESGPLNEEQTHFVNTLDRNTKRLLRIVGDLLFVAQSDAGRIAVSPSPQRLEPIVTHCVEEVRPSASARDIDLSFSVDASPLVDVDHERIGQVVNNLLTNAVKFTEPGGSIAVRLYLEEGQAIVSVADTGMGMSEEDLARLFTRFFRTDKATELAIQGTGLGLAICRTIVERHGGEIAVQSQESVGSTFFIKLPVLDAEGAPDD